MVKVPAERLTTWPSGQALTAFWMLVVSSAPLPLGLTVAQTLVRFGMPPVDSMPAIFQLALASRSGGKIVEGDGAGDTFMPRVPATRCTPLLSQAATVTHCG